MIECLILNIQNKIFMHKGSLIRMLIKDEDESRSENRITDPEFLAVD